MSDSASPALAFSAAIEDAAVLIRNAERGVVLTGAGISTPSGIPDFRSEGSGLWSRDEPMDVASLSTFRTAPERFFRWFQPLAGQIPKRVAPLDQVGFRRRLRWVPRRPVIANLLEGFRGMRRRPRCPIGGKRQE